MTAPQNPGTVSPDRDVKIVPVIQADREAAAKFVRWQRDATDRWQNEVHASVAPRQFFVAGLPDAIVRGIWDDHPVVQDFARHRLAFAQAPSPESPAVPVGMKAWHGGDSAPNDWDGGPVWVRSSEWRTDPASWTHPWRKGAPTGGLAGDDEHASDIIAYTPKPSTEPCAGDAGRPADQSAPAGVGEVERIAELAQALNHVAQWCESIGGLDMSEIVADNGITAGMVVSQEAREQARRARTALSATQESE